MAVQALQHPRPLSQNEKAMQGYTHQQVITYQDALSQTTAATALDVTIAALGAGMVIKSICFELITPFADSRDTGNNTTTIALKHGSTSLISAQEENLNGSYVQRARLDTPAAITTSENLTLTFGAPTTGKILSNLTQGEVHIFFNLEQPSRLG